jgi:hypothetical protein
MLDIEKNISNTTLAVGNLHCYMDRVGVPVHDLSENVATSIMFSEVTLTLFSRCTSLDSPDRAVPSGDLQDHILFEEVTSEEDGVTHES